MNHVTFSCQASVTEQMAVGRLESHPGSMKYLIDAELNKVQADNSQPRWSSPPSFSRLVLSSHLSLLYRCLRLARVLVSFRVPKSQRSSPTHSTRLRRIVNLQRQRRGLVVVRTIYFIEAIHLTNIVGS